MTEVPEHLLARSKARRAALGLGGDEGAAEAPVPAASEAAAPAASASAATPAPAAAAKPAAVEEAKAPEPLPPYVQAAVTRKKIPFWAMPALVFLPIWGVLYAQSFSKAPSKAPSQLENGATLYAKYCSSCHGGGGGGGVGRPLAAGEVVKTFPNIESQMEFVLLGSDGVGVGNGYGDPNRPGGQHISGSYNGNKMPSFKGVLTDTELLEVVRHERETLGGEKVTGKQLDDKGNRNHADGKPLLSDAGVAVDSTAKPMFDPATGKLVTPYDDSAK